MLGDNSSGQKCVYRYRVYRYAKRNPQSGSVCHAKFQMDPYESGLFLFCGKKCDRLKALLWEPDGFVLLYKVLDNGRYQWPRNEKEVKERTWEQFTSKYCNSSVIGQAPKIGSPNDSNAVLH